MKTNAMNTALCFFMTALTTLCVALPAICEPEGEVPDLPPGRHLQEALEAAGENRPELEKAIEHYRRSGDRQKLAAVRFLIENMPAHAFVRIGVIDKDKNEIEFDALDHASLEDAQRHLDELERQHGSLEFGSIERKRDIETVTAEFLIRNVDLAFEAWRGRPWLRNVSFGTFREYLLPYRGSNEPLENWREQVVARSAPIAAELKSDDYAVAAEQIREGTKKWIRFKNIYYMHPTDQGYSEMSRSGFGRCEDISNMRLFATRANGIASASDYTPYWARGSNNHAWFVTLDEQGTGTGSLKLAGKAAKVYRKMFSIQRDSLYYQNHRKESLPRWLAGQTYRDVTAQYMDTCDIFLTLDAPKPESTDFAYLCVFNEGAWKPIHWGQANGQEVTFTSMGLNLAYLPAFYVDDKIVPAGPPFTIGFDKAIHKLAGSGDSVSSMEFTHTQPQRYDIDRNIINEKEKVVAGQEYKLKEWKDGKWAMVARFRPEKEPITLEKLSQDTLYWMVKTGSRKHERIFTVNATQLVWW